VFADWDNDDYVVSGQNKSWVNLPVASDKVGRTQTPACTASSWLHSVPQALENLYKHEDHGAYFDLKSNLDLPEVIGFVCLLWY
jgi:hypothetical protein